jgi:hypothetical protein
MYVYIYIYAHMYRWILSLWDPEPSYTHGGLDTRSPGWVGGGSQSACIVWGNNLCTGTMHSGATQSVFCEGAYRRISPHIYIYILIYIHIWWRNVSLFVYYACIYTHMYSYISARRHFGSRMAPSSSLFSCPASGCSAGGIAEVTVTTGGQAIVAVTDSLSVSLSFSAPQWIAILVTVAWLIGVSCGVCATRTFCKRRAIIKPRVGSPLKEGFVFK